MARPNNFTILRFYRANEACPEIPLRGIAGMEEPLLDVVRAALMTNGITAMRGWINIVASPQQGCLEIYISPILEIVDPAALASLMSDGAQMIRRGIEEYGEPAKFIWEFVFGSCSVLQIWNMRRKQIPETKPTSPAQELIYRLSGTVVLDPMVMRRIRELGDAAAATGADKVTIEVVGGPELIVFDNASRRRRGLIAAGSLGKPPNGDATRPLSANLERTTNGKMEMFFEGEPVTAFTGNVDGRHCLVIWKSRRPLPFNTVAEVKGYFTDPDQIDPGDIEVDASLEDVEGVFVVMGMVVVD